MRQHMDGHFKRNRRNKVKGAVPDSRRWLLPIDEWLKFVSADADLDKPPPSAFDVPQPAAKAVQSAGAAPADSKTTTPAPVLRAPSEATRVLCELCGEEVSIFWDTDHEEWMLRDAANNSDDKICHASCLTA